MITRDWTVECKPYQNNKKPEKTMSQVNPLIYNVE